MKIRTHLIIFISFFLISCASATTSVDPFSDKAISQLKNYSDASDFNFLDQLVEGKSIVQLGESIHMTREQPLARIGIIRFLREKKDFDVVGFEGSAIDFWVAMDEYLHSKREEADAIKFRKMALFGNATLHDRSYGVGVRESFTEQSFADLRRAAGHGGRAFEPRSSQMLIGEGQGN